MSSSREDAAKKSGAWPAARDAVEYANRLAADAWKAHDTKDDWYKRVKYLSDAFSIEGFYAIAYAVDPAFCQRAMASHLKNQALAEGRVVHKRPMEMPVPAPAAAPRNQHNPSHGPAATPSQPSPAAPAKMGLTTAQMVEKRREATMRRSVLDDILIGSRTLYGTKVGAALRWSAAAKKESKDQAIKAIFVDHALKNCDTNLWVKQCYPDRFDPKLEAYYAAAVKEVSANATW